MKLDVARAPRHRAGVKLIERAPGRQQIGEFFAGCFLRRFVRNSSECGLFADGKTLAVKNRRAGMIFRGAGPLNSRAFDARIADASARSPDAPHFVPDFRR